MKLLSFLNGKGHNIYKEWTITAFSKFVHEYIQTVRRNVGPPREMCKDRNEWRQNKVGMAYTLLLLLLW